MNVVALVGRLTRDPEKRLLPSGTSVVEFSIAVDKTFGKKEGEPDAYFFRVKAWNKTADYVANYLTKGRLVSVSGRLEQRKYQASDGTSREIIEVVADNVQGLDRPRDGSGEAGGAGVDMGGPAPSPDEYDPFADE